MRALLLFFVSFFPLFARETTYPYLSEDVWPRFCNWRFSPKRVFDPTLVQRGDIILIEDIDSKLWETLEKFTQHYLPRIQYPVILVTPRTDYLLPGRFDVLLQSEKIAAWFVQNIDRPATDKLFPLPIGLSAKVWRDPAPLDRYGPEALASGTANRPIFAYVNFAVHTEERRRCLHHFQTLREANIQWQTKPFEQYIQDLAGSIFVVSPPGNGEDCHRTWEALLMGCYPIVKTSTLDPLFEGLPVVIIERWEEVTEEFLRAKLEKFSAKSWPREKLYAPYWFHKVSELQAKVRACSG